MKICNTCGASSEVVDFPTRKWKKKDGSYSTGLDSMCKTCRNTYHKDNYWKNLQQGDPWLRAGDIVNRMVDRTKKKGHKEEVEWTKEEVYAIIKDGKCEVTGIEFDLTSNGSISRNPFTASPDRIDTSKGYTKDNVRWVVFIYNAMRNNFKEEDVQLFIRKLKES